MTISYYNLFPHTSPFITEDHTLVMLWVTLSIYIRILICSGPMSLQTKAVVQILLSRIISSERYYSFQTYVHKCFERGQQPCGSHQRCSHIHCLPLFGANYGIACPCHFEIRHSQVISRSICLRSTRIPLPFRDSTYVTKFLFSCLGKSGSTQ